MAIIAGLGPDGQPKVPAVTSDGELLVADERGAGGESRLELLILRELREIRKLLATSQGLFQTFDPLPEIDQGA